MKVSTRQHIPRASPDRVDYIRNTHTHVTLLRRFQQNEKQYQGVLRDNGELFGLLFGVCIMALPDKLGVIPWLSSET